MRLQTNNHADNSLFQSMHSKHEAVIMDHLLHDPRGRAAMNEAIQSKMDFSTGKIVLPVNFLPNFEDPAVSGKLGNILPFTPVRGQHPLN